MRKVASVFTMVVFCLLFVTPSPAQFIWNETFPYATSGDLTVAGSANWLEYNAGSTNIQLASGSLTYTNYPESGLGNKINLAGGGQGVVRTFATKTSGKVYLSFMANLSAAPGTAASFVHFEENPVDGNSSNAMLFVKDVGSGNFQFALRKNFNSVLSSFSSSYTAGTMLLVISYEIVSGGNNDIVRVWVNPDLSGPEPSPTVQSDDPLTVDVVNIGAVVFVATSGITTSIAGLRVSQSWSDAPLPVQLAQFLASTNRLDVQLTWSTSTETNNYGFEVERRGIAAGGQVYDPVGGSNGAGEIWEKVGFVQGAGTSTSPRDYSYVDNVSSPGRYAYRIKQIDLSGAFTYYNSAEVEVGLAPKELALGPNYPNPFNPSTKIEFTVPDNGRTVLKVFNMLGQEVATLYEGDAEAGKIYQREFDASSLPTGVYVSRLEFGGQAAMRKMLFVK